MWKLLIIDVLDALIRSTKDNTRTGIFLLEGLLKRDVSDGSKRDYVYYLAVVSFLVYIVDTFIWSLSGKCTNQRVRPSIVLFGCFVDGRRRQPSSSIVKGIGEWTHEERILVCSWHFGSWGWGIHFKIWSILNSVILTIYFLGGLAVAAAAVGAALLSRRR